MLAKAKEVLKRTPIYVTLIVERRAAEARRLLQQANIYPESLNDIIADCWFSKLCHLFSLNSVTLPESG